MDIGTEKPIIVIEPAAPPIPLPVKPPAPVKVPVEK
jgi:hypothetical protein